MLTIHTAVGLTPLDMVLMVPYNGLQSQTTMHWNGNIQITNHWKVTFTKQHISVFTMDQKWSTALFMPDYKLQLYYTWFTKAGKITILQLQTVFIFSFLLVTKQFLSNITSCYFPFMTFNGVTCWMVRKKIQFEVCLLQPSEMEIWSNVTNSRSLVEKLFHMLLYTIFNCEWAASCSNCFTPREEPLVITG
jgi:hypothetical protein